MPFDNKMLAALRAMGGTGGSGGGGSGGSEYFENGIIKQEALPEGYPYEKSGAFYMYSEVTVPLQDMGGMRVGMLSPSEEFEALGEEQQTELLSKAFEFEVTIDGENYVVPNRVGTFYGMPVNYAGNLHIYDANAADSGEDFVIIPMIGAIVADDAYSNATEITVSMGVNFITYYPMKKEFLPDDSVMLDTLEKPTGMPAEITWDGNTKGRVGCMHNGIDYYKVSDLMPTYNDLRGQNMVKQHADGSEYAELWEDDMIDSGEGWLSYRNVLVFYKTGTFTLPYGNTTVPETGVYFWNSGFYVKSMGLNQTMDRKGIVIPSGEYFSEKKFFLWVDDNGGLKTTNMDTQEVVSSNLPPVTADNNGSFLRVVNGAWAIDSIPTAEEASF